MIWLYLLIFIIIAGPGFYLNGNLITPTDIFLPILFCLSFKNKIKKYQIQKYLLWYIISIILSFCVGMIFDNGIGVSSILKAARFSFILLIPYIFAKYSNRKDYSNDKILQAILISGIISAFIAIYLFSKQSELYRPSEKFIFFGNYIYRAGGVFAEANSFGFLMVIMCMVGIESIAQKKFRILSIITVAVCGIGLIFSDSRSALFSLVVALFARFVNLKKRRNVLMLVSLIAGVIAIYNFVPSFRSYINNRILSVFVSYLNGKDLNSISSGRINVWSEALNNFSHNNLIEMLFGTGYKSESVNTLADNSYISTLITLGLFGYVTFVALWIFLIKSSLKFNKTRHTYFANIMNSIVIMFLVNMLFLDSMTFTRILYLLILIYMICYFECKGIIHEKK